MTPAPPVVRYRVRLRTPDGDAGREVLIAAEDVIAWVAGYGAALGDLTALDVIDPHAPEDTRRVQALQIGDEERWFTYLYPEPTPAEAQ